MSYSTFLADPIATRERGEWLIEFYIKNPTGVETILRFSYRGTNTKLVPITIVTDSIPANTKFQKRVIGVPNITQSLWESGKILSSSLPSLGSIKLTNQDGGLDQYSPNNGYQWSGCRCKIFFCDHLYVQETIGKVFDGYLGNVELSLPEVNIPLKGNEDLFETPLSDRVFRGTSYALELFDKTVGFGTPSALSLNGSLTLEGWIWIEALPTVTSNVWGWNALAAPFRSPWLFGITPTGQIRITSTIAGVFETPVSTATLSTLTPYHVSVTISGRTVTFIMYNDTTQVTVKEVYTNFFSNAVRDMYSGGGANEHIIRSANSLRIWWDELRVWNYARTQAEIEADRFRPLISGSIPITCVHRLAMDENGGLNILDSSASAVNGTITGAGTALWLWQHEGGPELAGSPKPDVHGERWGIAPVLVDPVRQGYCVAGGGSIFDVTSYEGALSHTMVASSVNFRTYITTTPAAGTSLRYNAKGLFKLGSQPTLPISALVKGYNGGTLGYVNTGATVVRDIITRRGPKIIDPTGLDTASFTSYAAANPGIIGIFIPQPNNGNNSIRLILDNIMLSGAGWWGYIKASTLFHIEKYTGPGAVANYNFTEKNTVSITPLPPNVIIYKVIVRYRENNVVLKEDQVALSVKSTTNWQQWTQQWQSQERSDQSIRDAYPGKASVAVTFDTYLQYQEDAGDLADYLLSLLKGVKLGWSVVVTKFGYEATIGQTATESIILSRGASPRLGLNGLTNYSILTTSDNPLGGTTKLELWGTP